MNRQTRADGKPRNAWWLWMARRARMDGKSDQELEAEKAADELTHDEVRAARAAEERDFAKKLRANGNEAMARQYEARADELEKPLVYPWPPGTSRALAEIVALKIWADAPVADAPDAALHGIYEHVWKHRPHMVYDARAELLDNGASAAHAAKLEKRLAASKAATERVHAEIAAGRIDTAAAPDPDPFDPARNGVGEYASAHPGERKKRKARR